MAAWQVLHLRHYFLMTAAVFATLPASTNAGWETYVGHVISPRSEVAPGPRVTLLYDLPLPAGYITAVHAYLTSTTPVQIQVWRLATLGALTPRNDPAPSPRPEVSFPPAPPPSPITNGGSLIEESEALAMVNPRAVAGMFRLVAQKTMTMDYAGNVIFEVSPASYIDVEDGDFLGFYTEGNTSSAVSGTFEPIQTRTIFYNLEGSLPEVGSDKAVAFEDLGLHYTFSLGVIVRCDNCSDSIIVEHNGTTGPEEPIGATGVMGAAGDTGATGDIGVMGAAGATGATGDTGVMGATGGAGNTGPKGSVAVKGGTGAAGSPGPAGGTGHTGTSGDTGGMGFTGSSGHTGLRGEEGSVGDKGEQGFRGHQGLIGATGPTGLRGPPYLDEDECVSLLHDCDQDCVNEFGGYKCSCRDGWQLHDDDKTCIDVDECLVLNGGCQFRCENTIGSYTCSCPHATSLSANRHTCQDMRECLVENGGCAADQLCVDTYASFYCVVAAATSVAAGVVTPTARPDSNGGAGHGGAADGEPGSDIHTDSNPKDNEGLGLGSLLTRHLLLGLLIWLVVLTLLMLALLLYMIVKKRRDKQEKDMFLRYAQLINTLTQPEKPFLH